MTYTAITERAFRDKAGSLSKKIASEFTLVDAEIDTVKIKSAILTAGLGTRTAVATSGVDLASGSNAVYYGVFHATQAMTIVNVVTILNEAYVKDTTDAVVILKDRASSPVTKCTYTMPAAGRAAKSSVTTTPSSVALAAGDILDLYITASGSSSGTGYVDVVLNYTLN